VPERLPVTVADVEAAAARIAGAVLETPTAPSRTLSALTGAEVFVKFENLQFTASFKERGARNKLLLLTAGERARGVVAASAGNHAQAVALHAGQLGIPATIVMPVGTPNTKVSRTEELGARVVVHGTGYDDAAAFAQRLAAEQGLVPIHAFDDPAVIAGQGTVALEMLEAVPTLEVLLVPVGGGGLLAGCAVAATSRRPGIEVVGVEAEAFAAMRAALGKPVRVAGEGAATIADGIAVKHPGAITREIVRALATDVVTVGEEAIEEAIGLYLEVEKTVAEGAGAATLAALLEDPARHAGRRVGLVLSGGNIDLRVLANVVIRALVRSGRLVHVRAEVPDVPGSLGLLTTIVGEEGGNILELWHRRDVPTLSLQTAAVHLTVETRDREHVASLLARLRAAGLRADVEEPDAGARPPVVAGDPAPGGTPGP
jgi:threonine dehydratase